MATDHVETLNNVHHGRNVKRARLQRGIKQEALAVDLRMTQQNVSRLESQKVIDELTLERISKILQVPLEYLKTTEEPVNISIENNNNNTYNDNGIINESASNNNLNHNSSQPQITNHVNPIDKITELYERLLQTSEDKIKLLEEELALAKGGKTKNASPTGKMEIGGKTEGKTTE